MSTIVVGVVIANLKGMNDECAVKSAIAASVSKSLQGYSDKIFLKSLMKEVEVRRGEACCPRRKSGIAPGKPWWPQNTKTASPNYRGSFRTWRRATRCKNSINISSVGIEVNARERTTASSK